MSRRKRQSKQTGEGPGLKILLVAIPVIGTIVVALFAFPPFQRLFDLSTASPPLTAEPTLTVFTTASFTPAETHTFVPTATFELILPSETATITFTPKPELPFGMQVSLVANQTRGRIPLNVKLNTKNTFFRDAAGAELPCGACNYTWQVRQGSNIMFGPQEGQATFEFTFRDRGTYFVTVVICRSQSNDCGSSGALIVAE